MTLVSLIMSIMLQDHTGTEHTINVFESALYMLDYNVKTTPQMYILDKDKKIIMKNIGAEQLPEVMEKLMQQY